MMQKCPHCGAALQEQAQFCLYCMRPLAEKPDVTPGEKKRKWILWLMAGLCLAALCTVAAVLLWPGEAPPEEQAPEYTLLTNFDDFSLRAVYLSGKDSLTDIWDADSLKHTHSGRDEDGDLWELYKADVHLEDVKYQTAFCEGGIEVLTAITGLTDETYEQGLALAECTVSSVFNYHYTDLGDMLRDPQTYPRSAQEQDLISLTTVPDPAEGNTDAGTQVYVERLSAQVDEAGHFLFVDFRTRTWQGRQVYDILILCTQEFEE